MKKQNADERRAYKKYPSVDDFPTARHEADLERNAYLAGIRAERCRAVRAVKKANNDAQQLAVSVDYSNGAYVATEQAITAIRGGK